ncbi:MAG: peptidoglycan DL-endopeptidase CwlO [Mycobacterium sp.]|nr:peptidoglycan DL-endopeptidase CwlO [Mycobacterium sp.]
MTIADAISSMQGIEAQISQISGIAPRADVSSASSTGGASFASTLDAVSGQTVTPSAGQMADNGTTGADVVADAQKYIGVPYVFGGTTTSGMDCSGLVQRVYEDLGIQLPRLVSGQSTIGESVPSLADAQPGDIISCDGGNHIVIYAGNGMIIQAPKPGEKVEEVKNWITPSNVVSIRRIVPTQSAQSTDSGSATGTSTQQSALVQLLGSSGTSSQLASLLGGSSSGLFGSSPSSGLISSLLSGANSASGLGDIAAILAENAESSAMSAVLGSGPSGSSSGSSTAQTSSLLSALMSGAAS